MSLLEENSAGQGPLRQGKNGYGKMEADSMDAPASQGMPEMPTSHSSHGSLREQSFLQNPRRNGLVTMMAAA